MLYVENIDKNNLGDLPGLIPKVVPESPEAPNCHNDKALSIYDFALIEAWSKMYKLPKYTRVASPNPNQTIRNNSQLGTYNPNYPNQ